MNIVIPSFLITFWWWWRIFFEAGRNFFACLIVGEWNYNGKSGVPMGLKGLTNCFIWLEERLFVGSFNFWMTVAMLKNHIVALPWPGRTNSNVRLSLCASLRISAKIHTVSTDGFLTKCGGYCHLETAKNSELYSPFVSYSPLLQGIGLQ
jgi:hypothetical protein